MVSDIVPFTERFMWVFNTLFHQAYAVVTVYIFWIIFYNSRLSEQFTWHVVLSSIAYVPLMGEAIILFADDNVWSRSIKRTTKYWIHGSILFVSAVLVTIGIALIIEEKHGSHFKSTHGWTGFVSWIFVLISQILGFAAAKPQTFSKVSPPVYIKFFHNLFGLLGYIFGIVSLAYGMKIGSFSRYTTKDARNAAFWILGIATTWSTLAALKSGYNQLKSIFS